MSYISFKKIQFDNHYSFLIKIDIQEYYLRSTSSYSSDKDIYYASSYLLRLTEPIKNINELDENTYYICFDEKEKLFGLKKKGSSFIKLLEFEKTRGLYNEECPELKKKIFNIMLDNGFIELLNFTTV